MAIFGGTLWYGNVHSGVSYLKTNPIFSWWSKRPTDEKELHVGVVIKCHKWGYPKSCILIRMSHINHPAIGYPQFRNPPCNDDWVAFWFAQGSPHDGLMLTGLRLPGNAEPDLSRFENQKGMDHRIQSPTHKMLSLFAIHQRCLELIYQAIFLICMPISYHQDLTDAWYNKSSWTIPPFCPWCWFSCMAMEVWTLVRLTLAARWGVQTRSSMSSIIDICLKVFLRSCINQSPVHHDPAHMKVFYPVETRLRCVFLPRRPQFSDSKSQSSVWSCLGPGWGRGFFGLLFGVWGWGWGLWPVWERWAAIIGVLVSSQHTIKFCQNQISRCLYLYPCWPCSDCPSLASQAVPVS